MPLSDDATKMLLEQLAEDRGQAREAFAAIVRIEADLGAIRADLARGAKRMDEAATAAAALATRVGVLETKAPRWDSTAALAKQGAGTLFVLFLGSLWALVARGPHSDAQAGPDHSGTHAEGGR